MMRVPAWVLVVVVASAIAWTLELKQVAGRKSFVDELSPLEKEKGLLHVVEVYSDFKDIEPIHKRLDLENGVNMASGNGNGYICFGPKNENDIEKEEQLKRDETKQAKEFSEIKKQLEELKGTCFVKRKDYWSYKICPFQTVEQIHYEGSVKRVSFDLGNFVSFERQASKPEKSEKSFKYDEKNGLFSEWVQIFQDGTNGRETKVIFGCQPGIDSIVVTSIEEVQVHKYEIRVVTPLACHATPEWQAKQLLQPLRGQCIRRSEGWWTYELCFERYLKQFHKEKDGRLTEFQLGEFDSQANLALEKDKKLLTKEKSTNRPAFQQKYTGGTKCDLKENTHRASVILFTCESNNRLTVGAATAAGSSQTNPTSILSITESPSCFYVVKVHTPHLCNHPFFKQGSTTRRKSSVVKVHCVPESTVF